MAAAALADEARTMDLADRFLNSECVKRMLQADQVFVDDSDDFFPYRHLSKLGSFVTFFRFASLNKFFHFFSVQSFCCCTRID